MVHTRGGQRSLTANGIYSLNLVEYELCELRLLGILRTSPVRSSTKFAVVGLLRLRWTRVRALARLTGCWLLSCEVPDARIHLQNA